MAEEITRAEASRVYDVLTYVSRVLHWASAALPDPARTHDVLDFVTALAAEVGETNKPIEDHMRQAARALDDLRLLHLGGFDPVAEAEAFLTQQPETGGEDVQED